MSQTAGGMKAIEEARDFLAPKVGLTPEIGVILGTGLGTFAAGMKGAVTVPYKEIPNFPATAVESHAGELVTGTLSGHPTAILSGRPHFYEGHSMRDVAFPVRVLRALGVRTLVITSASGGLNPLYEAADLVLVVDHINLMGENPLVGPNDDALGPRFPDMSEPYSRELMALARDTAREDKVKLQEGIFAGVAGPNLETRAEYRFLRWAGADLVGMSVVPETIAAVHAGMKVLAISVVTDLCLPDALEPVDIPKILANAAKAEPALTKLVTRILKRLPGPGGETA
ncbi:MAG TPA: purine-nucleoside phosphorylase [Candidatus Saccharimonadales bacterium]|nr:purine-nucleoside phosphorylase [Candidatus Saccharimonadales bacterium]